MRIVIKISGEALKGENGLSDTAIEKICSDVKELKKDNELILVVGGGNFWRGRNKLNIASTTSDYIGMLATVMNSLAISSYLNEQGLSSTAYSAFDVTGIIEKAEPYEVEKDLKEGKIVVFGGGLGIPNLSTDMTTVSKAIEYKADLILMSKNIDAIYDKDPKIEGAKKIKVISHEELLDMSLKQGIDSLMVLDLEALTSLAKHKIPLYVYNSNKIKNIQEVFDNKEGTKVVSKETL